MGGRGDQHTNCHPDRTLHLLKLSREGSKCLGIAGFCSSLLAGPLLVHFHCIHNQRKHKTRTSLRRRERIEVLGAQKTLQTRQKNKYVVRVLHGILCVCFFETCANMEATLLDWKSHVFRCIVLLSKFTQNYTQRTPTEQSARIER